MKKFARIVGTGSYLPPRIITNSELEKSLDTTDEWITSRTGIKERRIVEDQNTCDLALEASIKAVEMAELKVSKIAGVYSKSLQVRLVDFQVPL